MRSNTFERLEPRAMLTGIYDDNGELIPPPSGGAIIGLGGPNAGSRIADDYGVRHNVTVLVHDQVAIVTADLSRVGNFKLPTVRDDGSVVVIGSDDADQITATRVNDNQDNIDDGEFDVVMSYDENGKLFVSPNSFDPTAIAKQLKQLNESLTGHQAELADAVASGNQDRIDRAQQRVDIDLNILSRFETQQAKLEAGKFVRYTLAGVYDCYIELPEELGRNAKLTIDAKAGADKVTVGSDVPMKASIFGGSGPDTLTSGKKPALLFGGGGNDKLISRSTKGGTLDGGTGADQYFNRGGSELNVIARKDGDRLVTDAGSTVITKPGIFGQSTIGRKPYYLVKSLAGQIDLLG